MRAGLCAVEAAFLVPLLSRNHALVHINLSDNALFALPGQAAGFHSAAPALFAKPGALVDAAAEAAAGPSACGGAGASVATALLHTLADACPALRSVSLARTLLPSAAAQSIAQLLRKSPQLQSLDVSGNPVGKVRLPHCFSVPPAAGRNMCSILLTAASPPACPPLLCARVPCSAGVALSRLRTRLRRTLR